VEGDKNVVCHYLRDFMFSLFDTVPECDRQTHTQTDRETHDDSIYHASIASRGKNHFHQVCGVCRVILLMSSVQKWW